MYSSASNCSSTTNPLPEHFKFYVAQHWCTGIKMWPSWHFKSSRRPNFQISLFLCHLKFSVYKYNFYLVFLLLGSVSGVSSLKHLSSLSNFLESVKLFTLPFIIYSVCTCFIADVLGFVTIYVATCLHSRKIQNNFCWKWDVCPMWKLHSVTLN